LCRNRLLKYFIARKIEGRIREGEEEVVSRYWMTLRKEVYPGN
jgi:hypothetical protein